MSGSPLELANAVASSGDSERERELLHVAVYFLLRYQFVQCGAFKRFSWRVLHGTGMGLTHSGEVADMAFFRTSEVDLMTSAVLCSHGILGAYKFKDDIIASI